ncbi:MAG: hypothetical protein E6I91_01100 [Chloroflexi bacterium]|nr:MAG: hypothetical protein E6I91_01100 [Chloroflexota bacterium]
MVVSFPLQAAFQTFPTCLPAPSRLEPTHLAPVRGCHLVGESAQRVRASGHEDDGPLAWDEGVSYGSAL